MQPKQKTLLIILAVVLGCFLVALVPLAVLGVFAVYVYGTHQQWNEEIAAPASSPIANRLEPWQGRSADTFRFKEENPSLGGELADVKPDRVEHLARARELADQVHEARSVQRQLEQRRHQLAEELAERREIMEKHYRSEEPPADVSPPAERDPPAELSGIITNVSRSGLIEVSVGSDDGLREGHVLDVLDQDQFVTRAVVLKTTPNRSVCRISHFGPAMKIEKGYRVAPRSEE
jgi:hypothetical protein